MTVAVGDVFRVTCRFRSTDAGDVVNVYHVKVSSVISSDDDDFVSDVEDWLDTIYANVAGTLGGDCDPYDLRIDQVELVGGQEQVVRNVITKTWTLASPPNVTGDKLPLMDAAIVNLRTNYPRVFGRKYLGSIPESNQADGVITAGNVAAIANYAADVIAEFFGTYGDFLVGVLSSKAPAISDYFAPFIGYVVNSIIGTQRRRRINRGS